MLLFLVFAVSFLFAPVEKKSIEYTRIPLSKMPLPDGYNFKSTQKDDNFSTKLASIHADLFKKKGKGTYYCDLADSPHRVYLSKFVVSDDEDSEIESSPIENSPDSISSIKKKKFEYSPSMMRLSLFLTKSKEINNLDSK
jgi:hypothetical protein